MRRLSWKLSGALLIVALVSVGLMALLTNLNTTREFQQYVQTGNQIYSQRIAEDLAVYYIRANGWNGVEDELQAYRRNMGDRVLLADSSGTIVADTSRTLVGQNAANVGLAGGAPVSVSGSKVGEVFFISRMGMGMRGGMMQGGSDTSTITADLEEQFIDRINSYLWIAGFISIAAAFVLGLVITRQITRPVYALKEGATRVAAGNLDYRVKVESKDELGDLAAAFNLMAASLEKDEEMRRRLITDIAHELRTPLTVIDGTVTAIQDGVFAPDREHLDTIKEQTAMLTRLVADLRDLSLAESGQLKLERVPTDLADFLRRKLTQFEAKAREKNIKLQLDAAPDLPSVDIDRFRIDQVMTNLLANALRHTPNSGSIAVGVKNTDGSLVVSVADTGEGIPPEHLPHMFERFYRVESARSRMDGGAGLGLAIVKHLVMAHGGTVSVESTPGKGSTFSFTLPVNTEDK